MRGGILHIGGDDLVADEGHTVQHAVALGDDVLPSGVGRVLDIRRHQPVQGRLAVGQQIDGVAVRFDRIAGILHIRGNLYELPVRDPQVHHIEVVPHVGPVLE